MPRPQDPPDATSEQLAAALAKIGLARKHAAQRAAGPGGLTPLQDQALEVLAARRGGLRLSELARELAVRAPTASDAVATLERKGLLAKRPDPEDGRAVLLRATTAGRRRAARAGGWSQAVGEAARSLDGEERGVLLRALLKVLRGLQERGEIPLVRMCATCTHFRPFAHAGARAPHHCALMDAPLADRELRAECGEHEALEDPADRERAWQAFARG